MVIYAKSIVKRVDRGLIPKGVFLHIHNAVVAVDLTKDLDLFDITQLTTSKRTNRIYYRLRKGKYRAVFYIRDNDLLVVALDKREDVYRKWQTYL